jgi:demethylmenaquinone methyltransferase/2-methoxy-6-polyprenyl-1,4-benzoquinol methylase
MTEAGVKRSRSETQAAYDRLSRWYDGLEGFWEKPARELALAQLSITPGERVFDTGCGTGASLLALRRLAGPTGWVCGIDLSAGMLRMSRRRLAHEPFAGGYALTQGDAAWLPLRAGSFDAILMSFVLELFDDPEIPAALAECHRVLKPGGRLGVAGLSKAGQPNRMRDAYEWGHEAFPGVLDCRPIYVQQALEAAHFCTRQAILTSLWGLPVEIVVGEK